MRFLTSPKCASPRLVLYADHQIQKTPRFQGKHNRMTSCIYDKPYDEIFSRSLHFQKNTERLPCLVYSYGTHSIISKPFQKTSTESDLEVFKINHAQNIRCHVRWCMIPVFGGNVKVKGNHYLLNG